MWHFLKHSVFKPIMGNNTYPIIGIFVMYLITNRILKGV